MLIHQANLNLLVRDPDLSPAALKILLTLWAGSSRRGWWGKIPRTEADRLGISLATFYRGRSELVKKRLIAPPSGENLAYRVLSPRHPWQIISTINEDGTVAEGPIRQYAVVPGANTESDDEASGTGDDEDGSGDGADDDERGVRPNRKRGNAESSRARRRMFPASANC